MYIWAFMLASDHPCDSVEIWVPLREVFKEKKLFARDNPTLLSQAGFAMFRGIKITLWPANNKHIIIPILMQAKKKPKKTLSSKFAWPQFYPGNGSFHQKLKIVMLMRILYLDQCLKRPRTRDIPWQNLYRCIVSISCNPLRSASRHIGNDVAMM